MLQQHIIEEHNATAKSVEELQSLHVFHVFFLNFAIQVVAHHAVHFSYITRP